MLAAAIASLAALLHAQPLPAEVEGAAFVDAWPFGEIEIDRLLTEDASAEANPFHQRFAEAFDTLLSPADTGTLTTLANDRIRWRLRLESDNGLSVNFGSLFDVPPSAVITLRDAHGRALPRTITAADASPDGELWSPLIPGRVMEIDATMDAEDWEAFRAGFWITRVSFGYREMGGAWSRQVLALQRRETDRGVFATDSCLVDILCPLGDGWRDVHAEAVGLFTLSGFLRCSGALMNTTAEDGAPIFMTAHHCTPSADPSSIVLYWNMRNSVCRPPYSQASGEIGDGEYADFTLGGVTVLADFPEADFALTRINNAPDPSYGLEYLGWDRSEAQPDFTVGISHPGVQEQRIHIDYQPAVISQFDATHAGSPIFETWLIQVEEGGVQGGSSGSALLDHNGRVIGVATTARPREPEPNYCPQQIIEYGRLSYAWDNDPAFAATLDPLGTGQLTLDYLGFVPAPVCSGDVDSDGDTDIFDFADLAAGFGEGPAAARAMGDLTGDGWVNVFDFAEIAADFGCEP